MFVLFKIDNENEKFVLLPRKSAYTVGRLSTDLILSEDLSISRTHVRLSMPSTGSDETLTVEDLGSRYGTFINTDIGRNKKMNAKSPTSIQVGDKIRFGALKNVWQLSQLKLVTTASQLTSVELQELAQLIGPLGSAVSPTWTDECSHLTMNTVSITVKLLNALLENKPIVRLEFWREFLKVARRIHVSEEWPKPEDYAPVQPADMPSIKWRPERTKLFAGITFVFMNRRHLEMYGPVVLKASGACKDLKSGVRKPFLTKSNVVVIQYVSSTQSQATETIFSVQGILEQAGLRPIPDYEIGLAILHCSMEKFCNPSHKVAENSLATTESMDSSILVPNTERGQTEQCSSNSTEFIVADSQRSEIYAPSTASEQQSSPPTEPTPEAVQPSKTMMQRKQNNAIFLDSSVEDVQPSKTTAGKKTKRKIAIVVDSSDEEHSEQKQLRKKTKTMPKTNSVPETAASENVAKADAMALDEDLVDTCQLETKKPNDLRQKQPTSISPRRSTRRQPLQKAAVETTATISPRRSTRGKQSAEKVKVTAAKSDSSEDEDLFQFKSKSSAPVESAQVKPTKGNVESNSIPAEKPLPSPKVNKPTRISVRNFHEKSQKNAASQSAAPVASQSRKRLRLQQLNESDSDDNENLFQFGGAKKPKNATNLGRSDDSNDGGMFNFKSNAQQEHSKVDSDEDDQDSVSTEPFEPEIKTKSKYFVPKPKAQPRKINVSGWLSCSGLHVDVKPEPKSDTDAVKAELADQSIKEEAEDDKEKLEHVKWLASLKDSIQVRLCNMSISTRNLDETDAADKTASVYSGRKNFKKFVKKTNVHLQQSILPLQRVQLVDGMVSGLST